MLNINPTTGVWSGLSKSNIMRHHVHDHALASGLKNFFISQKAESIGDLGCGTGFYTKLFNGFGLNTFAYDGNPDTFEISDEVGSVLDLSNYFKFPQPFDWILSLEVGEHIPSDYEQIYINNLDLNCSKGIILSWAIEGQGGDGHVNCRNNDYIKSKFSDMGYINDLINEGLLRKTSTAPWFKNTIMVFRKQKI